MKSFPKKFTHRTQFAWRHRHLKAVQIGWTHYLCTQDVSDHKRESVGVTRDCWGEVISCFVQRGVCVDWYRLV